jgi:hypothetical protein
MTDNDASRLRFGAPLYTKPSVRYSTHTKGAVRDGLVNSTPFLTLTYGRNGEVVL